MDKEQQVLFEAHAILQAHANVLLRYVQAPFHPDYVKDIRSQVERVDAAHKAFVALAPAAEAQKAAA